MANPHIYGAGSAASGPGGGGGGGVPAGGLSDFHKSFADVPANENAVHDCQCSLSRHKLLRVGRLYMTPMRICFSGLLVDPVSLPWDDVQDVQKKTTMFFDQIIVTPVERRAAEFGSELCFTGFVSGSDAPYSTIRMLWGVRAKYAGATAEAAAAAATPAAVEQRPRAASQSQPAPAAAPQPEAQPEAQPSTQQSTQPAVAETPPPESAGPTPAAVTPPPEEATPARTPSNASLAEQRAASPQTPASPQAPKETAAASEASASRSGSPQATGEAASAPSPAAAPSQAASGKSGEASPVANVSVASGPKDAPAASTAPGTVEGAVETLDGGPASPATRKEVWVPKARISSASPAPGITGGATTPRTATRLPDELTPGEKFAATASLHNTERTAKDSADVLKSFPKVPKTESIVDTFQCSYVSGVHRIGKMHITGNYVLFFSVMLQDNIAIKLSDVKAVEKATALLVLEGVTIVLKDGTKHDFTSFVSREKAFAMLQQLVTTHQHLDRTIAPKATPAAEAVPEEGDAAAPAVAGEEPPFACTVAKPTDLPELADLLALDQYTTEHGTVFSPMEKLLEMKCLEAVPLPAGYSVHDVFRAVLDKDACILALRDFRKETETTFTPWVAAEGPGNGGTRVMKCQTLIKTVFTKPYPFEQFDRFILAKVGGKPTLVYHVSGQPKGVQFSDTFRAEAATVWTQEEGPDGRPQVSGQTYQYTQFLKKSFVMGKIKNESISQNATAYKRFHELVVEHVAMAPPAAAGKAGAAPATGPGALPPAAVNRPEPAVVAAPAPAPAAKPVPAAPERPEEVVLGLRVGAGIAAAFILRALYHCWAFDAERLAQDPVLALSYLVPALTALLLSALVLLANAAL